MIQGTSGEDDNGEQWTEIEELDDVEGEENTPVLIQVTRALPAYFLCVVKSSRPNYSSQVEQTYEHYQLLHLFISQRK
ncbi:hypothetical protein EMCRGX_G015070 [Ephydatia muelleri]